ncbi:MAG: hypothetical protein Q8O92_16590 [Candidatus Latescibacter sp.]|nr:hypothetical protein [Candidatus Latescibacter sp.]
MEVLINVIIILVILFAIIKRMQDVARKGGDITGQPSAPPMSHGWPERPVSEPETFPEEMPYEKPEPYRESRQFESPRKTFAEKNYRYEEERKQNSFPSNETEPPGEYQPAFQTVSRVAESSRGTSMQRRRKEEGQLFPVLAVCKSELVRGIILSEILGKPLALRRENRW